MSRWRPPTAKSSAYITPEGYAALEKELTSLWAKRRIVNDALAAAAAEGDRSENAEYIYRKKEQAGIDRRIRYLQKRTPDLKIINKIGNHHQIFFGAKVKLEKFDPSKNHKTTVDYRIVGPDETGAHKSYISIDSPLAKALLKKKVGAEVAIKVADDLIEYCVLSINY